MTTARHACASVFVTDCDHAQRRASLSSFSPARTTRAGRGLRPMPDRSEYQPLTQHADDENDGDVGETGVLPPPVTSFRGLRRAQRPRHIDLSKLDTAFKR